MDLFEISRVLTPIALLIVLVVLIVRGNRNKRTKLEVKCNGCGKLISGKCIRVSGETLNQPLNYCSSTCKTKYLDRDKIKFAKFEVE
ncbi:MAG: hypothetical protein ACI8ZM_001609 [Crocinitomix sp.]|jgi:hypothetical protein